MRLGQWWSKGRRTGLIQCERSYRSFLRSSANTRIFRRRVRKNTGLCDSAKTKKPYTHSRKQPCIVAGRRTISLLLSFPPFKLQFTENRHWLCQSALRKHWWFYRKVHSKVSSVKYMHNTGLIRERSGPSCSRISENFDFSFVTFRWGFLFILFSCPSVLS